MDYYQYVIHSILLYRHTCQYNKSKNNQAYTMQSNDLEEKQNYLRAQIIDSGIDPQPFMVFMGASKGEGENINLQIWTLPELKKIVKDFKESLQQELKRQEQHASKLTGIQASERNRHSMIVADRVMGAKLPKKQKVFYERDDLWDYEMSTKIDCSKTHKFFDFKVYPQIACKGVQVKKVGGFLGFGGSYVIELTLVPNFTNYPVVRKSEDVDWLHQLLVSQYPGAYVPPLGQTPQFDPEDKKSVSRRCKQIMQFLNSLVQYEQLLNNKSAHVFFKESDTKAFQNYKYKNATVDVGKNLQAFQNLEGYFPIQISQRVQQFIKNSSKFSKEAVGIFNSIDVNLVKLQQNLGLVAQHSANLARDFEKLREKYVTLYDKCGFDKIQEDTEFDRKLAAIFAHLKTVFTNLQVHSKKQCFLFQDFNEDNVKGVVKQFNQFESLQKWYKRELDAYLTLKLSLSKRKQQFFLDLSKKQMEERQKTGQSKETTLAQKQQMYRSKFPTDNKLEEDRRSWQGYINRRFEKSFLSILRVQERQLERKLTKVYPILSGMLSQRVEKYQGFAKYLEQADAKIGFQPENMIANK